MFEFFIMAEWVILICSFSKGYQFSLFYFLIGWYVCVALGCQAFHYLRWFWGLHLSVYLCAVSSGVALSEIAGPFSAADVAADCSAGTLKEPIMWVISYALMAVCAVVLIILLLLLVLPCRHRDRSGEITDESSLVRHRIKWLRGNGRATRMNAQVDSEQSPSTVVEKGVMLSLAPSVTPGSECLTDSRLHSSARPIEVDSDTLAAS